MSDVTATAPGPAGTAVSGRRWVTAFTGGIVIWFLRLLIGTWLVRPACELGLVPGRLLLGSVTLVALAATGACLWLSLQIRRAASDAEPWWEAVGFTAVLINGISVFAIASESIPILFVDPCA